MAAVSLGGGWLALLPGACRGRPAPAAVSPVQLLVRPSPSPTLQSSEVPGLLPRQVSVVLAPEVAPLMLVAGMLSILVPNLLSILVVPGVLYRPDLALSSWVARLVPAVLPDAKALSGRVYEPEALPTAVARIPRRGRRRLNQYLGGRGILRGRREDGQSRRHHRQVARGHPRRLEAILGHLS